MIRSKATTKEYRKGWDKAFGRPKVIKLNDSEAERLAEVLDAPNVEGVSKALGAISKVKECKDVEPEGGGSIRG